MRRLALCLAVLAACSPEYGEGGGGAGGKADGDRIEAPRPLTASDLPAALERAVFERVSPELGPAALASKLAEAHDAEQLLRSFAGAYFADLAQVDPARIPGGETLCFGDAHPGNFGVVELDGHRRFVFNDLDDSGYCLAALDALHFFVVLGLSEHDGYLEEAIEQYVDALHDPERGEKLSGSLEDELVRRDDDQLSDFVAHDRLELDDGMRAVSDAEWSALELAMEGSERLAGGVLLDAAVFAREGGGSGGSERLWILVAQDGDDTLYELKPVLTPGTDFGRHQHSLGREERLPTLVHTFWNSNHGDFLLPVAGRDYAVRDKLARHASKVDELSDEERHELLRAEATILAARHRGQLEGVKKDSLRRWLLDSSQLVIARWKSARREL